MWRAGVPIDGAAGAIEALRATGIRILFLTNDPGSSRSHVAARLEASGIPASADDVITSAAATARVLGTIHDLPTRKALVIGPRALRDEIVTAGFQLVSPDDAVQAAVVVVGGHEAFDYHELRAASQAVRAGARLLATGRDAVYPTPDGLWPATGAILAAIEVASGAVATVVGKPEPVIFEMARSALAGCRTIAVVGDHVIADIAGAKAAGMAAILVLTGTSTAADVEQAAVWPDLVVDSLVACVAGLGA